MRAAPAIAFPSNQTLTGWWAQLAPFTPRSLWVGELTLYHVEALVRVSRSLPLDRLEALILQAVSSIPFASLQDLEKILFLTPAILAGMLRDLASQGLLQEDASGKWQLTGTGLQALSQGEYRRSTHERRRFHFVLRETARRPPHFLRFAAVAVPCSSPTDLTFTPDVLAACVGQPLEWKQRHGFPEDIEALVLPESSDGSGVNGSTPSPSGLLGTPRPWERVIVVRSEHVPIVVVRVPGDGPAMQDRVLGFVFDADCWALETGSPAFALGAEWAEVIPELGASPSQDEWRASWLGWCEARGIPSDEAGACACVLHGAVLRVTGPAALMERLAGPCRDLWLLAGEGRLRAAARVELGRP
jgi:hypothetical protein